jgi:hypothetical protein
MTFSRVSSTKVFAAAAFLLNTGPALALSNHHDPAQKLAAPISGACTSGASAYSISTDLQTTRSKSYQDVTGTAISFTQGASGCVELSFSAEATTVPGELLLTQVLLDGRVCAPSDNIFASDSPSSDLSAHAMNYICGKVAAGNHTAKVQFRSRFGSKVALDYRTTIVRYTP